MASPFDTGMSRYSPEMTSNFQRPGSSRSRTHSISSDRPSTAAMSILSPPLSASPEAAFIAASAASQIVTNDHDSHADTWYDQHGFQPSGETVLVSLAALRLVNGFLDHLLFNFLSRSGSTTLAALRPAVTEVLKPKLAKDAINNADEELREYLGGGDDDEFLHSQSSPSPRDWDLELVWKRTRLRCMVYSSLGDMEEEDEDHHMEEGLLSDDDENLSGAVSPAVAIFLTSILEFLGEQALISAGQAAWHRMRVNYERDQNDGIKGRSDVVDRIVVDEVDMERVALDRTLGRLWRAWKKRIRYPVYSSAEMSPQSLSRERVMHFRQSSVSAESAVPPAVQESAPESPAAEAQESLAERATAEEDDVQPAAVPLPMSERDIDEIEVPGLVHYSDEETEEDEPQELDAVTRPKSMMIFPLATKAEPPTPTSEPHTPTRATRKRANSLPTPAASPDQRRKATAQAKETAEAPKAAGQVDVAETPTEQVEDGTEHSAAIVEEIDNQDAESATGDRVKTPEVPPVDGDGAEPQPTGLIPKIVGAVAALATGAGAGAVVADRSERVETKDDGDDSDFEVEEAQILTSSRISIGTNISNRRSLRLVNVASPRTPSIRSQMSSAQEQSNSSYSRSGEVSRASSIQTQSNVEDSRPAEDGRGVQVPVTSSSAVPRSTVALPISEAEERAESATRKLPPTPAPSAVVAPRREAATEAQPVVNEEHQGQHTQAQPQATQPLFGSYTLTPENMREIEGSPRTVPSGVPGKGRKSEDARQPTRDRAASAATTKSDARVPRESLVEFAEFIRATGPSGADANPTPLKRNQSVMANRTTPRQKPSANMSLDYGRPSMGGSVSRARLQARGATVDNDSDNSDLIDFIRRGPPSTGNNNPRIPRTVAPFRTTMDSDLLKSAVGGKAMDATLPDIHDTRYSQASTNVTEMSAPSVQSSINSQSALLSRKQPPGQSGNPFDEPDMMPQRKQHRVRDPYAIDLSDEEEEDDDFDPLPRRKPQQPKEESLIDFLNSAPPPPESAPVPFNLPRTQTMPAQATQAPKKKASAPSLMSRFRQNSSNHNSSAAAGNSNGLKSPTKSQKKGSVPAASKGYIPIQVNIPTGGDLFPSYGSSSTATAAPSMPPSTSSSRPSGRVPMKRFEPRDAVSVPSRGTSDLADFLRSSGPPPTMNTPPFAAEQPETNAGSRLFGRRKKSMGFA
ncbi:hypothetical protein KVR01_001479 [Diaporthe batatas]|uniref:uncharacterized protein n=1 Tax=Diaporthe batatas TaxID=748121 RepID=UPI001D05520C|nr:uncharacterized protein KVR01_001479 [Diaporthe batatas]KAG8168730.1 hypothetical protein KVR01_001479 [Diaporthe batatas]